MTRPGRSRNKPARFPTHEHPYVGRRQEEDRKGELRETIVIIVQALLIALVFRTFAFEPFSIPTASMQSNLMIGDYILASKYSYGYSRYSLPYSEVPWNGRIMGNAPERGDIAVIRPCPRAKTTSSASSACRATRSR